MESAPTEKKSDVGNLVALSLIVLGLAAFVVSIGYTITLHPSGDSFGFTLYACTMTIIIGAAEFYLKKHFLGQFALSIFILGLSFVVGFQYSISAIVIGLAGLVLLVHSFSVSKKLSVD